ncbi:hypothetical protein DM02DRAFT_286154 [Periconia macrospinosa]|uniref:RFX-type winged-helix domain-containing protein n=1 Tax=Periconia macrospinosa TaxID=97972 RepID=A0A2V1EAU3_9PLEO|nr:hypothetical protein DM02DRAFT_286154 [Periconia macrospinosa]
MAAQHHQNMRSRPNTPHLAQNANASRPLSRASTASIHSFGNHENTGHQSHQYSQSQIAHSGPQHQVHQHSQSHGYVYGNQNMTEMHYGAANSLMHNVHQIPQQENVMDPAHQQQLMAFSNDGVPLQVLDQNIQASTQAYQMSHANHRTSVSVNGDDAIKKKAKKSGGTGGARDDKELRELITANSHRTLVDVANDILILDRSSKAEKMKQLFAMIWLRKACSTVKDASVPRNRVYSKYAEVCGDQRVTTLNPASFGKLVRVIFPGINTRRLGVRGESKYHYVDLALNEELEAANRPATGEPSLAAGRRPLRRQDSVATVANYNSNPPPAADTASFPAPDLNSFPTNPSQGRVFTEPFSQGFHPTQSRTAPDYVYELKFPKPELLAVPDDLTINLPDIHPYLPSKYDEDSANALVALYRTHCTSVVDSVRFCKEKQFWKLFTSFHGTLTVPVQKLFAMSELAPWIRECDWLMYQKMIRNVSQLTLQAAPASVLKFFDNIGKTLHSHISATFASHPLHVLEAKLEPATLFAHLMRQMVRVNSTAHAAAVMLTVDNQRELMWSDWETHVKVKRVLENVLPQSCAPEEVYYILTNEIREILIPSKPTWSGDEFADPLQETVIDRIAAFLTNLPSRFPDANARNLILCINAVGSAALREITVENGPSFQGWWLTKVFVDEMAHWLATFGGFLSHTPAIPGVAGFSPDVEESTNLDLDMPNGGSGDSTNSNNSRLSSMGAGNAQNHTGNGFPDPTQNTGNSGHGG